MGVKFEVRDKLAVKCQRTHKMYGTEYKFIGENHWIECPPDHAERFRLSGFDVRETEIQAEEPETVNEISPAVASEPVQKRAYRRRPK